MRRYIFILFFIFIIIQVHSQENIVYQTGLSADQNLNAIMNLAPYSIGGIGFDNRYQGTKGSPRLFDKLLPSYLKVKGQDNFLQLETDIDLVGNRLLFIHPKTGKLIALPSDFVNEVIIKSEGKELIFRVTGDILFEKEMKGHKFFQVLKDGQFQFIKIPEKTFVEDDYKGAYSADRRYDEYLTGSRYFIMCRDSTFHQVQLTRKSLVKLFPDRKELIYAVFESDSFKNNEDMVIYVLGKF